MKNSTRQCFAVDLRNDAEAIKRYTELHKRWSSCGGHPRIARTRHHDDGNFSDRQSLFMIMEVNERYSPELCVRVDADTPQVQTWASLMNTMQVAPIPSNDAGAGNWRQLQRNYRLSDQP